MFNSEILPSSRPATLSVSLCVLFVESAENSVPKSYADLDPVIPFKPCTNCLPCFLLT